MRGLKIVFVLLASLVLGYGVSVLLFIEREALWGDHVNRAVSAMWLYEYVAAHGELPSDEVCEKSKGSGRPSRTQGVEVRCENGKTVLVWERSRARVELIGPAGGEQRRTVRFYTHRGDLLGELPAAADDAAGPALPPENGRQ